MEAHADSCHDSSLQAIYESIIQSHYEEFVSATHENRVPSLQLAEYAVCAFEYNLRLLDDKAYAQSHSALWSFLWSFRGHHLFRDLHAEESYAHIDEVTSKKFGINRNALELVFGFGDAEYEEFLATWDTVIFPLGESPLTNAMKLAQRYPLQVTHKGGRERPRYQLLVSAAGWLQVIRRDNDILLPCREVAAHLDCTYSLVAAMRRNAEKDGFIKVVGSHMYAPGGKGKATEYRFDVARFPGLLDESARDVVPLPQVSINEERDSTSHHLETAHRTLRLTGQSDTQDAQDTQGFRVSKLAD